MEHRKVQEKSKKISNPLSFWRESKCLRTELVSMLYAKWKDPETNNVWVHFQPQNIQYIFFFQKRSQSCNKNIMQQSSGSKWVQVDRKMRKASESSAFAVLQGKWLFILQEIQHMQMSLFPFPFFLTTSTLERWLKRISDSWVYKNAQGVCCNIFKTVQFRKQLRSVICMFLQVKGMSLKMESDLEPQNK